MSNPLNNLIFSEREFLRDLQKVCTKWDVEIEAINRDFSMSNIRVNPNTILCIKNNEFYQEGESDEFF